MILIEWVKIILAFLGAGFVALNYRELIAKNKKGYKPHIFPSNTIFHYFLQSPGSQVVRSSVLKKPFYDNDELDAYVNLDNIGSGVATNLNVNLTFESKKLKEFFDFLNTIAVKYNLEELNICYVSPTNKDFISIENGRFSKFRSAIPSRKFNNFDYLLPIKDRKEDLKIQIPFLNDLLLRIASYFLICLYQIAELNLEVENKDIIQIIKDLRAIFYFEIEIEYSDLLNQQGSNKYKMEIDKVSYCSMSEKNVEMIEYSLKRKED